MLRRLNRTACFSLVSLAAKASLSFSAKESNQRKLPAAPDSVSDSAFSWVCASRARRCRFFAVN